MVNPLTKPQPTMSSREIAELTGKTHKNVIRDIREMMGQLDHGSKLIHQFSTLDARGYTSEINLPRRECEILITGYDTKRRAAVIDRWMELEVANREQALPTTTGNPLLDALIKTQLQVNEQEQTVKVLQNTVAEITRPLKGVSIDVIAQTLRKRKPFMRLSKSTIKNVAEFFAADTGFHKVSRQKGDGTFYPEYLADLEATIEALTHWFNECEFYPSRQHNRDFYHSVSGIGGQYAK